jgi:hypothetical protein
MGNFRPELTHRDYDKRRAIDERLDNLERGNNTKTYSGRHTTLQSELLISYRCIIAKSKLWKSFLTASMLDEIVARDVKWAELAVVLTPR